MEPKPVEKPVTGKKKKKKTLLCYCGVHGWQRLCAFSLSILIIVYKGCYKYMFWSSSYKSRDFNCKHPSNGVALQTIH